MFKCISDYLLKRDNEGLMLNCLNNVLIIDTSYKSYNEIPGIDINDNYYNVTLTIKGFDKIIVLNGKNHERKFKIICDEIKYLYIEEANTNIEIESKLIGCVYIQDTNYSNWYDWFSILKNMSIYHLFVNKTDMSNTGRIFYKCNINRLYVNSLDNVERIAPESSESNIENLSFIGLSVYNMDEFQRMDLHMQDEYLDSFRTSTQYGGKTILLSDYNLNKAITGYEQYHYGNSQEIPMYDCVKLESGYKEYIPSRCSIEYLYVPVITPLSSEICISFDMDSDCKVYICKDSVFIFVDNKAKDCSVYLDISLIMLCPINKMFIYDGASLEKFSITNIGHTKPDIQNLILTGFKGKCALDIRADIDKYVPGPYIHKNCVKANYTDMIFIFEETIQDYEEVKKQNSSAIFPLFFGNCKQLWFQRMLFDYFDTYFLFKSFTFEGECLDRHVKSLLSKCKSGVESIITDYKNSKEKDTVVDNPFQSAVISMSNGRAYDPVLDELNEYVPKYVL